MEFVTLHEHEIELWALFFCVRFRFCVMDSTKGCNVKSYSIFLIFPPQLNYFGWEREREKMKGVINKVINKNELWTFTLIKLVTHYIYPRIEQHN